MKLKKSDKEFRSLKTTYLEFKQLEMDRVLTSFLMRLNHKGFTSRLQRKFDLSVDGFTSELVEDAESFQGFGSHRDVVRRWVETHLMDVVNRGKPNQAVAAPRPLHGYTYRFRNPKHSRSYGADQHLYELFYHARHGRGQRALDQLERFFFPGEDKLTGKTEMSSAIDVETQAVFKFTEQTQDARDTKRERFQPLCVGAADLLADDVLRLLAYEPFVPRTVMVDYLKILFSFHLALYHVRLLKLLPALVRRRGADPTCDPKLCPIKPESFGDPQGDCPYRVALVLDIANVPKTPMAALAERSAEAHYRRIPGFVKATFTVNKLDQLAEVLVKLNKLGKPPEGYFGVGDILSLLEPPHDTDRENYFYQRLVSVLDESGAGEDEAVDPEVRAILEMKLANFETFIEILMTLRGDFHRHYITQTLDSLFMKNDPGAFVAQPRGGSARRRFMLDSQLLEVLLQIAVLQPDGALGYHTEEVRVDKLLTFLRERYGLYIDRLPQGDGFSSTGINDREALRGNLEAFKGRLREIGFYRDLSDAYVTQTVTPRYVIPKGEPTEVKGI